jgi:hypothetical protein
VVPITCAILVVLFLIQRRGTAVVGRVFGPIMVVWFVVLAVPGVIHIARAPEHAGRCAAHERAAEAGGGARHADRSLSHKLPLMASRRVTGAGARACRRRRSPRRAQAERVEAEA